MTAMYEMIMTENSSINELRQIRIVKELRVRQSTRRGAGGEMERVNGRVSERVRECATAVEAGNE